MRYLHLLFDRHEIVFAEGLEAESFLPGPMGLRGLEQAQASELLALFPGLGRPDHPARRPARPMLRGWEARLLA